MGKMKVSSKPNIGGFSSGKGGFAKPAFAMSKKLVTLNKRDIAPVG